MNPRASAAATASIERPAKGAAICSMTAANASGWPRSGVMSLKTMPGLGKSGTSRIQSRGSSGCHLSLVLGPCVMAGVEALIIAKDKGPRTDLHPLAGDVDTEDPAATG